VPRFRFLRDQSERNGGQREADPENRPTTASRGSRRRTFARTSATPPSRLRRLEVEELSGSSARAHLHVAAENHVEEQRAEPDVKQM